jgi:hypothetical protein
MNMPRFTGEASLYKTTQSYRGSRNRTSGDAGSTVVTPQLSCSETCYRDYAICLLGCAAGGPVACAACFAKFGYCQVACPPFPGGVGGAPTGGPCGCPRGTYCCGGCSKQPGFPLSCDGDCIGLGEECT